MIRRCPAVVAAIIVLSCLPAVPSGAAEESTSGGSPGPNYLAFRLGGYFPDSSDLEDFDVGFNGEVALGRRLHRNIALEGSIGYWKTEDNFFLHQEIQSTYLLVTAKAMFAVGSVEPYVEGGGGFYISRIEEESATFSASDQDTSFGVHAGAGVNWYFTNDYFLGVGGRYVWSETSDFDISLNGLLVTINLGLRL